MIKNILKKVLTMTTVFSMFFVISTSAATKDVGGVQFTDDTKQQLENIDKLISKKSISIKNGEYNIDLQNKNITKLTEDEVTKLKYSINLFNEGIELGIFEINKDKQLTESNKYLVKTDFRMPRAEILDLDSILIANGGTMIRTAYIYNQTYGSIVGQVKIGEFFASQVRTGGPWDYKNKVGTNTSYRCTVNHQTVTMTGEAIGNANYGFAGRKVFGASLLRSAAGAYQIYSGTSYIGWYSSYFDDPYDQYNINRGISYSEGGNF